MKAVAILACPGYDMHMFGLTYRRFCGIYGEPTKVYTNHKPAHAEKETVHLRKIAREATKRGTK